MFSENTYLGEPNGAMIAPLALRLGMDQLSGALNKYMPGRDPLALLSLQMDEQLKSTPPEQDA